MKVLLIGNGGREHALAWKLSQSPALKKLWVAPGNPGIAEIADCVPIEVMDFVAIKRFVAHEKIDLVVIGPEDPLAGGLSDELTKAGVRVFGPSKAAAQLEADKWFSKELMRSGSVPTAEARMFTDVNAAEEFIRARERPMVVKAVGLAKGKGVTVCYRTADAIDAVRKSLKLRAFGDAGNRVVIEEMLVGPEVSILAFVDRRNIYLMESAQDHKAIDDGDTGAMTGGMGAYTPTPLINDSMLRSIERDVFVPILDGLAREGIKYQGVLYAGLMLTAAGPKVLEFNCRFGDPEAQPLMMRLKSDLLETLLAVAEGRLEEMHLEWDPRPAMGVVVASKGYPGEYPTGLPISGIAGADSMRDVKVFQGGTARRGDQVVTNGGRVLTITALGSTLADAKKRAYEAVNQIHFDGMKYRKDIGWRALTPAKS